MAAQARVEDLPDCLMEGELRRCTLVLRNTGASALRGIRAVTSGPGVHLAPSNAELASTSVESVLTGELLHGLGLKHIAFPAHRPVGDSAAPFRHHGAACPAKISARVMPDSAEPSKPALDLFVAGEERSESMQSCREIQNQKGHLMKSSHASIRRTQAGTAMRYIRRLLIKSSMSRWLGHLTIACVDHCKPSIKLCVLACRGARAGEHLRSL